MNDVYDEVDSLIDKVYTLDPQAAVPFIGERLFLGSKTIHEMKDELITWLSKHSS